MGQSALIFFIGGSRPWFFRRMIPNPHMGQPHFSAKSAHARATLASKHPWHQVLNGARISPTTRQVAAISGWWFGTSILFSHILGISSSQLTFIFFRGVAQPPTSLSWQKISLELGWYPRDPLSMGRFWWGSTQNPCWLIMKIIGGWYCPIETGDDHNPAYEILFSN